MSGPRPVPRTLVRTSRREHDALALHVIDGALPADLRGHLFVMAAAGDVDSGGLPRHDADATTMLSGDGLLTRIDFGDDGVTLMSRLMRPPDALLEEALEGQGSSELGEAVWWSRLERRKAGAFANMGVARSDMLYGARNQLNTAIDVLPARDGGPPRVLATWDAGQPWEIDAQTLVVQTPIGPRGIWRESIGNAEGPLQLGWPFPLRFATAHPGVDAERGEVFFASWSMDMSRFASVLRQGLRSARSWPVWERVQGERKALAFLEAAGSALETLLEEVRNIDMIPGDALEKGLRLLRWDGEDHPVSWEVLDRAGEPIGLRETLHQVLVTPEWVVFADTGFKFGPASLFQNFRGLAQVLEGPSRVPMRDEPRLLLVRRSDLDPSQSSVRALSVALRGVWPGNFVHAFADQVSDDGSLRIHTALTPGADVAEWLRSDDVSPFDGGPVPPDLLGCFALGVMDTSRVGTIVVRFEPEPVAEFVEEPSGGLHWGVGLAAAEGLATEGPNPARYERIYWSAVGFWRELYTQDVWDMYELLPDRAVRLEELRGYAEDGGPPPTLFAHDPISNTLVDGWEAPAGHFVGSPQLVGDRWLSLLVWHDEDHHANSSGTELWLFDRDDLAAGPVCRLSNAYWWQGLTMHTAWTGRIGPRTAPYRVSVVDELDRFGRFWLGTAGRWTMLRRLNRTWRESPPGPWAWSGDHPAIEGGRLGVVSGVVGWLMDRVRRRRTPGTRPRGGRRRTRGRRTR